MKDLENKVETQAQESNIQETNKVEDSSKISVDKNYIEQLRKEAAEHRTAKQAAKQAAEQALLENNEYKKLAEEYKNRLSAYETKTSELETNLQKTAELAKNWMSYEARIDSEVQELAKEISDSDRSILSAISDVTAKKDFLLRITNKAEPAKAPNLGQPNTQDAIMTVSEMLTSGKTADEIEKAHSGNWLDKLLNKDKPKPPLY